VADHGKIEKGRGEESKGVGGRDLLFVWLSSDWSGRPLVVI
jgi:hypothetical protein